MNTTQTRPHLTEADLVGQLAAAHRDPSHKVDASTVLPLDRAAAYRVQSAVMAELGETVGVIKTTILADGIGAVAAPLYASRVGNAPHFSLPSTVATGLEVEVGVVLGHHIPNDPALTEAQVASAVDYYFTGIEVVGSRYLDWKSGSLAAAVADNILGLGYVIGPPRAAGNRIDGYEVGLELAGRTVYAAPAKHGFETVLSTLIAYARDQNPNYPLKAGTIVTTGSLCGFVPISGPAHVVGRLGDQTVTFDLT